MKVVLRRTTGAQYEARNEAGQLAVLDGPPDVGGRGAGVRPMELLLMSLGGCSAVDVQLILQKQRQAYTGLGVTVEGTRADAVPAVFTAIHLHFEAAGDVDPKKLEHAVALSMEKYCSVARMLESTARITFSSAVKPDSAIT